MDVQLLMTKDMTPHSFFVRTQMQIKEFEEFDARLQRFYRECEPPMTRLHNGLMVVYSGIRFYRAKFIGFLDDNPEVFLIDEGATVIVSLSSCYGVDDDFVNPPAFCIQCYLEIFGKDENGNFSPESLEFFR